MIIAQCLESRGQFFPTAYRDCFKRVDARRGLLYDESHIVVAAVRRHGVYTITDFAIASRPGPVGVDALLVSLPSVL
jgi:hypothetical protein